MHIYVPDSHPANPAIVVAMHGCGGSGPGFYSGSEFASLADRYGFVVIYPQGIWYGRVRVEDVPRIVAKTLVGGGILVDLLIPESCLNNADCPHRRPQGRG